MMQLHFLNSSFTEFSFLNIFLVKIKVTTYSLKNVCINYLKMTITKFLDSIMLKFVKTKVAEQKFYGSINK